METASCEEKYKPGKVRLRKRACLSINRQSGHRTKRGRGRFKYCYLNPQMPPCLKLSLGHCSYQKLYILFFVQAELSSTFCHLQMEDPLLIGLLPIKTYLERVIIRDVKDYDF